MSIFGQLKDGAAPVAAALAIESLEANTGGAPEASADPVAEVDAAFAQERETSELNQGADNRPDIDLPEGEHGEDPQPTGDEHVKVDADNTKVTFSNEEGDYYGDDEDDDDLDREMDDDCADIVMMAQQLEQLSASSVAIETYGMTPGTMAIAQITGLLSGTALADLGLESVSMASKGTDPEAMMAIEALGDKLKEKAASFGAKVMSLVKKGGESIMAILNPLWNGITGMVSKLTSSAWDATKSAGRTIKAHPYKTIAAVVGAIVVVAGIVVACGGAPSAGAKLDVVKNFMGKIASDINSKIKFPGAAIKATVNDAGTAIRVSAGKATSAAAKGVGTAVGKGVNAVRAVPNAMTNAGDALAKGTRSLGNAGAHLAETGSAKALGWSQSAVKAIEGQLGRVWGSLKTGWAAFGTKATKLATGAGSVVADKGKKVVMAHAGALDGAMSGGEIGAKLGAIRAGASAASATKAGYVGGVLAGAGYLVYVSLLVAAVVQLVKAVVVGGFRMIAATFRALMPNTQAAAA